MDFEKNPIGTAVQWVYDIVESDVDKVDMFIGCKTAVRVIEESLQRYGYTPTHIVPNPNSIYNGQS